MAKEKTQVLYRESKLLRVTVSVSEQVLHRLDDMAMGVNRSRSKMVDLILMEYFFPDEVDESDPILDELMPGEFVRIGQSIIGVADCD
jgi:predicted transcriptional regulator